MPSLAGLVLAGAAVLRHTCDEVYEVVVALAGGPWRGLPVVLAG
jgi:hypothetical protein